MISLNDFFWLTLGLGLGALLYHAVAGQYFTWRVKNDSKNKSIHNSESN